MYDSLIVVSVSNLHTPQQIADGKYQITSMQKDSTRVLCKKHNFRRDTGKTDAKVLMC